MIDVRPDPDELLIRVKAEMQTRRRGMLKIFFGYAAGVGKTYSMLEDAHRAIASGVDLVVGYVEPHARPETQRLLQGLEILPTLKFEYRGVTLQEVDVDAAIARRPDVILVDELAHSNAEGARHAKRYQDIEDLLEAGINVWTTLNVQHIESLNDVVGQITGVVVRETIPDHVFDSADDIELVDVTPEELLSRLNAGKVYLSDQAQRAVQSFFRRNNLTALREMSLRQTAQRVHVDVEAARQSTSEKQPWATIDTLLVCVGPSPTTARVIRTAKRLATALNAKWIAVSVDRAEGDKNGPASAQIAEHFRLAERLGAETATLIGNDVAGTVLEYARQRNVTKVFIGKTKQPVWRRVFHGSVVDHLLEQSGKIDVYVIHGEKEGKRPATARNADAFQWSPLLLASGVVGVACAIGIGLRSLRLADAEANVVMIFLAAVVFVASYLGSRASVWASVVSVLLFDFFFVPPIGTFVVSDSEYILTFCVMLAIGLLIGSLTSRLKLQIENSKQRERRTSALYELGKQLGSLYGVSFLVNATGRKVQEMTGGEVVIYLKQGGQPVELYFGQGTALAKHPVSLPAAQWVTDHDQIAGTGTDTLPNAIGLFLPLIGSQETHGVIAVRVDDAERLLQPEQRRLLEACASQLSLALERDHLAIEAADARIEAETEQVRSSLLSGVSHDLKTPLAVIAGASGTLLESESLTEETRRQLLETVSEEADRLNRLLENILQMSKLDANVSARKDWHVLEEIIGSALHRLTKTLAEYRVEIHLPPDLPLIWVDGLLIEQIFINLLENATRYTPSRTLISISAVVQPSLLLIRVSDNGPGIPLGLEEKIFEKFYRATEINDGGRGSGLGLAICRSIARLHGGDIKAGQRVGGGAEFLLTLPLLKSAPQVKLDSEAS